MKRSHYYFFLTFMLIGIGYLIARESQILTYRAPNPLAVRLSVVHQQLERFGPLTLIAPAEVNQLAIVFAPASQSVLTDTELSNIYNPLLQNGTAAAVINAADYLTLLHQESEDSCLVIGGEIERLGQVIQQLLKLPEVVPVMLLGQKEGAWLSLVARFQSPDRFRGVIADGFCPLPLRPINLCDTLGLSADSRTGELAPDLKPLSAILSSQLPPLIAQPSPECVTTSATRQWNVALEKYASLATTSDIETLFGAIPTAPPLNKSSGPHEDWRRAVVVEHAPANNTKEQHAKKALIVFLSGDGGWTGIDQDTGEALAAQGYPLIGFSSLKYFWQRRTPEETAAAFAELIPDYLERWQLTSVALVGYSLGADVIPVMYNRLPHIVQERISSLVLLAPGRQADLEVQITDWLGLPEASSGISIMEEISRIPAHVKISCVYGADEAEELLCPDLKGDRYQTTMLPGGHHFDGEYEALSARIRQSL